MADFERRQSIPADRLRIYWAWNATGDWTVPYSPRTLLAPYAVAYKLYLISAVTKDREMRTNEQMREFLRLLIPKLRATLFPGKESH